MYILVAIDLLRQLLREERMALKQCPTPAHPGVLGCADLNIRLSSMFLAERLACRR
jgi:hypothetical protein